MWDTAHKARKMAGHAIYLSTGIPIPFGAEGDVKKVIYELSRRSREFFYSSALEASTFLKYKGSG